MIDLEMPTDESAPLDSAKTDPEVPITPDEDADGAVLLSAIDAKDPTALVEAIKRIAGK